MPVGTQPRHLWIQVPSQEVAVVQFEEQVVPTKVVQSEEQVLTVAVVVQSGEWAAPVDQSHFVA